MSDKIAQALDMLLSEMCKDGQLSAIFEITCIHILKDEQGNKIPVPVTVAIANGPEADALTKWVRQQKHKLHNDN